MLSISATRGPFFYNVLGGARVAVGAVCDGVGVERGGSVRRQTKLGRG